METRANIKEPLEDKIRVQQVFQGVLELFATHYLMHHVRNSSEEETTRMVVGASMAGLGYFFGPKIQDRLHSAGHGQIQKYLKENLLYAAGGAMLGSITGYSLGPAFAKKLEQMPQLVHTLKENNGETNPNGLLLIASAGWLGYSLFFNGKTKRERDRHLWGLGAGAIGYLYGPDLLHRMKKQVVPGQAHAETIEIYAKGSALLGGIVGGVIGFGKGKNILKYLGVNNEPK